jgi:dTDP-4-amino-4,6-dideoxygalactose transaminase
VRARVGPRTKVVIAVHMSGLPCDMDAFARIASDTSVAIIEDCAQAHGGRLGGQLLGGLGKAAGLRYERVKTDDHRRWWLCYHQ